MVKEHDLSLEVDHIEWHQVSKKDKGGCSVSDVERLEKLKEKWRAYSTEFAESEYMDIEDHTSMALEVGGLIGIIEEQQKKLGHYKNACEAWEVISNYERKENARLRKALQYIARPKDNDAVNWAHIIEDMEDAALAALKE